ncbi:MAG: SAM-dependent methyltransferase [Mariprofundaceae bacterium]|nr:SAM-dependent methyltransferase [Mariprofundaceae bacterium]
MSVNHNTSALERIIQQRIDEAGGWIPFDTFMHSALYEPRLGYYESAHVFGKEGDFVTGADMGPWLALGLADLIEWGWRQLGSPSGWTLVEQGGGSGRLFTAVLHCLQERGLVPARSVAIEASAEMRRRQQALYLRHDLDIESFAGIDEAGEIENCLMFCNELPDAFPVRCFSWKGGEARERGVSHSNGRFCWQDLAVKMDPPPAIDREISAAWPDGYLSEWNPNLQLWQQKLSKMIRRGFLFCVDYGYSQQEYYRSQRVEGTLLGHRGHQVVEDILQRPGSCDITAHIDFTTLRRIGDANDMPGCCFMSQGAWLAQSPSVQRRIESLAAEGSVESVQELAHAKRMLLPFGMGETFKLLIQSCHHKQSVPDYLAHFDRMHDLRSAKGVA